MNELLLQHQLANNRNNSGAVVPLTGGGGGGSRGHLSNTLNTGATTTTTNSLSAAAAAITAANIQQQNTHLNAGGSGGGGAAVAAAAAQQATNKSILAELDLVKRKADLELALKRNEAELMQQRRTSLDLAIHHETQRRTSLDLATQAVVAQQQQRRTSLDLATQAAAVQQQQRRTSLDLATQQRRTSMELAAEPRNTLEWQQRRNSLELALQQQQRRNSLELAQAQQFQRRNSLESTPRRFSLDHLYPRRNSTDFLRNNATDAVMRSNLSHILAEQFLAGGAIGGLGGIDGGRTSSLALDRRLSNIQHGTMNPIDPNHLDSLFDDGMMNGVAASGLPLGLQTEADLLREVMRRQSLLQSLNQGGSSSTGVNTGSAALNHSQMLNNQLAAAAQQQQQRQQQQQQLQHQIQQASAFSAKTKTNNDLQNPNNNNNHSNNNASTHTPAVANPLSQEEVTPFLTAVKSLQDKMQQSQASQKSIQTWDKKMGLKRSHSSTMTKTHRSRKQLRELFELQKKVLEQRLGKKRDGSNKHGKSNHG